jgi:hypothetical protein
MDFKSYFLNGYVDEEIYVEKLEGFEVPSNEYCVENLKNTLYGIKQAPRAWYSKIDKYFQYRGLVKSLYNPNIYTFQSG